jgi:hypothetical protein
MCIVLLHVKFQLKQKATVKVTAETVWRVKKSSFSAQFSTSLGGGTIYKRESIQLYCVCTHYSWTGFNKRISSAVLCENILQLNWFSVVCLYSIVHSALCFLISAFSFQPSAVSFQPSAFIFQPSAFSLQPSANNVLGVVRLQNKRLQKKRLHDDDRDWVPMQNDWVPMNDGKSGLLRWGTPT